MGTRSKKYVWVGRRTMMKVYFKFNQNVVELGITVEVVLLLIIAFFIVLACYPEYVGQFVQYIHGLISVISAN